VSKTKMLALYISSALALGGCATEANNKLSTPRAADKDIGTGGYIVLGTLVALFCGAGAKICYQHDRFRRGKTDNNSYDSFS
jgi:hypothetical protein